MSRRRAGFAAGSVVLLLIALTLPTGWYDSIPRLSGLPPLPIRGVTLLRVTILFEAVIFGVLALRDWSFGKGGSSAIETQPREFPGDVSPGSATVALLIITIVAIFARSISLGADLWIDEITPIFDYGPMSMAQVIGSYLRSNNHLLNTLLMKAAIAVFGEHEWSVRLPAMLFGVATIPTLYWVGRLGLSRIASLGAALLLAVSYHHIFFSQNARGYTAYLFFALVSTGALATTLFAALFTVTRAGALFLPDINSASLRLPAGSPSLIASRYSAAALLRSACTPRPSSYISPSEILA